MRDLVIHLFLSVVTATVTKKVWKCNQFSPCVSKGKPWLQTELRKANIRIRVFPRCVPPSCGPPASTCSWRLPDREDRRWPDLRVPLGRDDSNWRVAWTANRIRRTWNLFDWCAFSCGRSTFSGFWRSRRTARTGTSRWRSCGGLREWSSGPSGKRSWSRSCTCNESRDGSGAFSGVVSNCGSTWRSGRNLSTCSSGRNRECACATSGVPWTWWCSHTFDTWARLPLLASSSSSCSSWPWRSCVAKRRCWSCPSKSRWTKKTCFDGLVVAVQHLVEVVSARGGRHWLRWLNWPFLPFLELLRTTRPSPPNRRRPSRSCWDRELWNRAVEKSASAYSIRESETFLRVSGPWSSPVTSVPFPRTRKKKSNRRKLTTILTLKEKGSVRGPKFPELVNSLWKVLKFLSSGKIVGRRSPASDYREAWFPWLIS